MDLVACGVALLNSLFKPKNQNPFYERQRTYGDFL